MAKMIILYFYNVEDYGGRDKFSLMEDKEVLKIALKDTSGSVYSTSGKFMSTIDEFVEDYNDEYLDGGLWVYKLEMEEEDVKAVFDEVYGDDTW